MKRVFDFLFAAMLLVVLLPVYLVIAATVFSFLGSPVLFKQLRPGLHGVPFELVKFRSMRHVSGSSCSGLSDANRLGPFGRFLRRTSLDELPELLNILRGDMSFVGPRPLLMEYLPLYSPEQARRHNVRPGLTGWAQVNGRNAIDWQEKFELDVWYVDNQSFWLDVKILMLTIPKVLGLRDVAQQGHATMEPFRGNEK